jgi:murein DD-endopeptidase MepM/ murein hydrolase activator NlpD
MANKRLLSLNLLLLVVLLGGTVGWSASNDEIERQINQTKKKLTQTKAKEKSVMGNLIKSQQELDKISNNLHRINSRLGSTEQRISAIRNQINNTQTQIQKLQANIDSQQTVLGKRLVAIYKYGYQSYLQILFEARDFSEFINRYEMVGRYIRADLSAIKSLQQNQEEIARKKQQIVRQHDSLTREKESYARLRQMAQSERSNLASKVQNRQRELSMIQNDRRSLEKALDELEDLSRAMESQIRGLQHKNKTALGSGRYIWPTQGRITSYFGYRIHPILRKRKYHSGIDIAAPQGTPILASDSGVVVFSARNGGYGKMIIIDHGSGFSTVYAHCSYLLAGQGQTVTKGQEIAKVGTTGLSTGPHVHFEVRKDGVAVDPMSYL